MLDKIINLWSKNIFNHADKNKYARPKNPSFLTEPNKIIRVLREIKADSLLCSIEINGSRGSYNSSILSVKTNPNSIILDELIPADGNALLQEKKALKLSTFHQGVHLAFNLTQIETGISNGITYYKAPLPKQIFYPQQRKSPRIKTNSALIPFSGVVQGGNLVRGHLFDLSHDGACIHINLPANIDKIQHGDKIKKCQINFDNFTINFEFTVYLAKSIKGSSKMYIGGAFENLSSKSQAKLADYITALELNNIRKRKD